MQGLRLGLDGLLEEAIEEQAATALAVVAVDADHVGVGVGVARIIRYPNEPTAADLAVTVEDAWQGRGVATALLTELLRVRPAGVTQIVTTVAADNVASLAMLRRLGPITVPPAGGQSARCCGGPAARVPVGRNRDLGL